MGRTNTSRVKIMDTAASVFARNGYWNTSMDDVAASAGVAKGTLYYNFPTKADLFVSVIESGIEQMRTEWEGTVGSDVPERQLSLEFIKMHVDMFLDYGEISGIFFEDSFKGLDDNSLRKISEIREKYLRYIEDTLNEGIKSGALREIDSRFTAYVLIHTIYAACRRYGETSDPRKREFVYGFLQSLIYEGIGTRS